MRRHEKRFSVISDAVNPPHAAKRRTETFGPKYRKQKNKRKSLPQGKLTEKKKRNIGARKGA